MRAPLEERIAAHPYWTGEVLTTEQWEDLKRWRKENPDLVFHHEEEVTEGRFFRNYHPRSRNGINAGSWESAEKDRAKKQEYVKNNKEKIARTQRGYREKNGGHLRARMKQWYADNREAQQAKALAMRENNREKLAAESRAYYANNREACVRRSVEYGRARLKSDEQFYIKRKLSARLRMALLGGQNKKSTRIDAESVEFLLWQGKKLGISPRDFHVDHLFPISSFDLSDPKQQRVVNAPCNVWLMAEEDNLRKSDRFPTDEEIAAHGALLDEWMSSKNEVCY